MSQENSGQSAKFSLTPQVGIYLLAVAALLATIFWQGLTFMVEIWSSREEYNHGYLIPLVAGYLLWLRARTIGEMEISGTWMGVVIVVLGLIGFVMGELSSIYAIIQYAFLLTLFGVVIAGIGWRGFKVVWVPLAYLVFMIPLPSFFLANLSAELQLVSSVLGVAVIRAFGVSVFLEGNVIDLGIYQLQVAEACSGLNYLFPLMSFGFLCAALFSAPWWQRALVFVSSVPLTIFMNSFRIGVIGVLVENFGIEQAEGFLHLFEGWVVFMACVGLMFLLMWVFAKLNGEKSLLAAFGLDVPPTEDLYALIPRRVNLQSAAVVAVLGLGLTMSLTLQSRQELIPAREPLASFPLLIDGWRGRDKFIDQVFIDQLKVDDYLMADFQADSGGLPVELWIAYYDTQRKGQSAHSPRTCLPGGGWQIESLEQQTLADVGAAGEQLTVNRVVIAKGEARQLVYYWFVERGRIMTNEYLVKWQIFWDSLRMNRTDGALVRVTTFVADQVDLPAADERVAQFIRSVDPQLAYFLPQQDSTFVNARAPDSRYHSPVYARYLDTPAALFCS